MIFRRKPTQPARPEQDLLRCSFCNKAENEVRKLIAGPTVFICDECVHVCRDILADDGVSLPAVPPRAVEPPPKVTTVSPLGRGILACALCDMPMTWDEGLLIPERGVLCPGCVGEIEAALAEKGQP